MDDVRVSVQPEDFSVERESERLRRGHSGVGAIAAFSGLVRDFDADKRVVSLFLEHYPGMTEKSLHRIALDAKARWPVLSVTIIHRVGELVPGDQIVFVGVSGQHRHAAFAACEFIMDYLKTRAPFWKKTRTEDGEYWVEAKQSDSDAAGKWSDSM